MKIISMAGAEVALMVRGTVETQSVQSISTDTNTLRTIPVRGDGRRGHDKEALVMT
jgi:hypothetical protein